MTEPTRKGPSDDTKPNPATHRDGNTGKSGGGDPPNGGNLPDNPPPSGNNEKFSGHTGDITTIAFCNGGKQLVSGSVDKTVRFWDVETGKQLNSREFLGPIHSLAVTPEGNEVFIGYQDGWIVRLHLIPFAGHQRLGPEPKKSTTLEAIALAPDGRYLIRAGKDLPSDADSKRGRETTVISFPFDAHSTAFSSDSKWAALGDDDGTIHVFDVIGNRPLEKGPIENAHKGPILGLAFVPKTTQVISGGMMGSWLPGTSRPARRCGVMPV